MQIAKLYLRGNLVNYTSKNLNTDQLLDRDKIFLKIDKDPEIKPSKSKFQQKLADTIGGEYCDPKAAEIEWWTAAWRAILSVTYHIPLEYRIFAPTKLNNKKARKRGIIYDNDTMELTKNVSICVSEKLPIPPEHKIWVCSDRGTDTFSTNCRGLLSNPSDSTKYIIMRNGQPLIGPSSPGENSHRTKFNGNFGSFIKPFVLRGDLLQIIEGPDSGSTVVIEHATATSIYFNTPKPLIFGSNLGIMTKTYHKIMNDQYCCGQGRPQFYCHPDLSPVHLIIRSRRANPEAIFDNIQMRKLVKNYGWEFIGQILKENKREMTKTQIFIEDHAEVVALRMLESLFGSGKENVKYEVCHKTSTIKTETGLLPMSIIIKIAELKREFAAYNVGIQVVEDKGINIAKRDDTPIITKRITEVKFNQTKSFDDKIDEESTVRNSLEAQIASKEKLVSHFETMQAKDAMRELLSKLPDNAAKFISLMMSPPPELFEKCGGNPRERDIATYMGVKQSQIKKYKETIRLQMLALGMGPEDPLESQA